jgi:hypothetical protein
VVVAVVGSARPGEARWWLGYVAIVACEGRSVASAAAAEPGVERSGEAIFWSPFPTKLACTHSAQALSAWSEARATVDCAPPQAMLETPGGVRCILEGARRLDLAKEPRINLDVFDHLRPHAKFVLLEKAA